MTATTVPSGLTVVITYNGSGLYPIAVGSYTVVGTVVDPVYVGSATGTLVISPAPTPTPTPTSPPTPTPTPTPAPPYVTASVTSPTQGENLLTNSTITITASASTKRGTISFVNFYVNGSYYAQISSAPYTFGTSWNAPATLTVTATAFDSWGDQATSPPVTVNVVNDVAPVVSVTSPADGTVYPAKPTVVLAATATSQYSTISSVAFYQGSKLLKSVTAAPYTYSWSKPAAGTYTLTAVAKDAAGETTTSAPVTITVN